MREKNSFPLLETLARGMGCAYLSDLKYLDASGQRKLAGLVRSVPVQAAEANAWNDALTYLTGQPAQPGAGQARQALRVVHMLLLRGRCGRRMVQVRLLQPRRERVERQQLYLRGRL